MPDAELLERFIGRRDEAAFEVLLWRHGPMVLGLCRRILRDSHTAEDAFQATFLLLAQKAASIAKANAIGSWLYKVAYRVAQRARRQSAREPACTSDVGLLLAPVTDTWLSHEQYSLLDDAIQQLPERYRAPVVLCYMQGKKIREAATELGCPTATISTRLRRARALLERNLRRRGVAFVSGESGVLFTIESFRSAIPGRLVNDALRVALTPAAGAGTAADVVGLANGVSRTMALTNIR